VSEYVRESFAVACIVFIYMKIFVCLIKQAHLLAIISKFGGGEDSISILWLSFAQQKLGTKNLCLPTYIENVLDCYLLLLILAEIMIGQWVIERVNQYPLNVYGLLLRACNADIV
jgi:hypothetical protein